VAARRQLEIEALPAHRRLGCRAMRPSSRLRAPGMRALLVQVPRVLLLAVGFYYLASYALAAQGGRPLLWRFNHDDRHRFTAMAMLTGTLRLRNALSMVTGDEQIYNGAGYTNWGFGVPLLQVPFHAVARHMKSLAAVGFFPDRAIYFIYLMAMVPVLWLGLSRLLAARQGSDGAIRRDVISWAATFFILATTLFPLMSSRFIVYEETICYLIVFELVALSAYIYALDSQGQLPIVAMGVAAGIGLLVRPTGLIYLGVWGLLVLLERRSKRSVFVYAAAVAPCVVFWLYSNWVRSGSLTSFGYENAMPWFPYHTPMQRFGYYPCADSLAHSWDVGRQLFKWFFVSIGDDKNPTVDDRSAYLQMCHFNYELRSPDNHREAFFGLPVLVFLAWTLMHHIVRRERDLAVYVPYATFVFIFCNFMRGPGFCWRYVGDFWTLVVLIGVQYVRRLSWPPRDVLGFRLALVLVVCTVASFKKNVEPSLTTVDVLDKDAAANLAGDFTRARTQTDPPLPAHIDCRHASQWPYHNGQGWRFDCSVDTFSNVFLGVPRKSGSRYELRLVTQTLAEPSVRVFLNGRIYTARKSDNGYVADVTINRNALNEPDVMVTVEWTKSQTPIPGTLVSIELV
jgi:hypothetical protein